MVMVTKRPRKPEVTTEDREESLQREWERSLPCADCDIRDVCKYAQTFHRPDFNPEVFTVSVSCKIKPKVYARFNPAPESESEQLAWDDDDE